MPLYRFFSLCTFFKLCILTVLHIIIYLFVAYLFMVFKLLALDCFFSLGINSVCVYVSSYVLCLYIDLGGKLLYSIALTEVNKVELNWIKFKWKNMEY